ncbi:hypothetical protein, partial [Candidatus Odyssella thessalonicensis]|uniref:hypothetical protein n=1 Tax=Candidatus Odyssella thessalonicensis TaxID=84647 RepID=UPI000225A9E7
MNKLNKSIFTLCLALGSANAKGLQGFYVGADLGSSYSNIDLNLHEGVRDAIYSKGGNHLVRANLGLSVGYDHIFQNSMMLGLEVFGDYNLGGKK